MGKVVWARAPDLRTTVAAVVAASVFGVAVVQGLMIDAEHSALHDLRGGHGTGTLLASGAVLALLFSALGWLAAGRIARPLRAIADSADALREGGPPRALTRSDGVAEIRSLSASLDALVAELEAQKRALAESESHFRALAEALPAILFITDAAGEDLYLNPQFAKLTGVTTEALMGGGWRRFLHPDDRARMDAAWAHAVATGSPYEIEYRFRRRDGEWRWFLGRSVPQRGADGRIVRWLGTCTDIHDLRLAQEAQRENEERLRLGARVAGFGTFDWRAAEDRHLWSPELYAIFGLAQDEPVTLKRWLSMVHPDDLPRFNTAIEAVLTPGAQGRAELEHRIVRPDGTVRSLHAIWQAFFDATTPAPVTDRIVGAVRDVTERRAAETAQRQARAELLHASRLSLIGEVASTIAHEVNQPLGAAGNFLQVARTLAADTPLAAVLARAGAEVTRAAETVRRVRAFAADRSLDLAPHPVGPLIEDACALALLGNRGEGVALSVRIADGAGHVLVDRVQFQQVVINLVRNAAEALAGCAQRRIDVSVEIADPGMAVIAVADTGPGVDPAVLPRLFSPFVTSKSDGTGLGLSTSRSIVDAHGGRLWADANGTGGAVFRMTLPLALPTVREGDHDA